MRECSLTFLIFIFNSDFFLSFPFSSFLFKFFFSFLFFSFIQGFRSSLTCTDELRPVTAPPTITKVGRQVGKVLNTSASARGRACLRDLRTVAPGVMKHELSPPPPSPHSHPTLVPTTGTLLLPGMIMAGHISHASSVAESRQPTIHTPQLNYHKLSVSIDSNVTRDSENSLNKEANKTSLSAIVNFIWKKKISYESVSFYFLFSSLWKEHRERSYETLQAFSFLNLPVEEGGSIFDRLVSASGESSLGIIVAVWRYNIASCVFRGRLAPCLAGWLAGSRCTQAVHIIIGYIYVERIVEWEQRRASSSELRASDRFLFSFFHSFVSFFFFLSSFILTLPTTYSYATSSPVESSYYALGQMKISTKDCGQR